MLESLRKFGDLRYETLYLRTLKYNFVKLLREGVVKNKSLGTFERIKRGNAAEAYRWASRMMYAGFSYAETFEVVNHRTGVELAEWDELIRDGEYEFENTIKWKYC